MKLYLRRTGYDPNYTLEKHLKIFSRRSDISIKIHRDENTILKEQKLSVLYKPKKANVTENLYKFLHKESENLNSIVMKNLP